MGGGVRGEGGLSLVTGASLLPLATAAAAGGAPSANGRAQASLPGGEVVDGAGKILEQKKRLPVSIYKARSSI